MNKSISNERKEEINEEIYLGVIRKKPVTGDELIQLLHESRQYSQELKMILEDMKKKLR